MDQLVISNKIIRKHLESELRKRQETNSQYSLRAFSYFLDIDAPTLSKILSGKKQIGKKLIIRLSERLKLDINHVITDSEKERSFELLSEDQVQYLSKWFYYGILELLELKDFQYDYSWIAKKLKIEESEAREAIERMIRLGLLEIQEGKLIDSTCGKTTNISSELTSKARIEHQRSILSLGIEALDNVDPEYRDQSSMTVSINSKDLPEARKLIKEFRRNMSKFLNNSNEKDAVYNLGISLYPLTRRDV